MSKKSKRKGPPAEAELHDGPLRSEELPKVAQHKVVVAYVLDQDEVNRLIQASLTPYIEPPVEKRVTGHHRHETYTEAEADALVNGTVYKPDRSRRRK